MCNNHWEMLCERVNDLIEIGVTNEDPFHKAFEKELKNIYNWPPQHIKHKPPVKIGSETKYPDIVLEGDGFGIIIEVKAPGVILGDDQAGQLISYMNSYFTDRNSIKCKYGLLIGRGIKVYFQDDPNKKPQLITSFSFDVDSSDGNSLSEILSYDECSDEKLMEYMDKHKKEIAQKENGNTTIIQSIPPSNKFLDEVMNHYNSICDHNFKCFKCYRKDRTFGQIAIIKTEKLLHEKLLHYEFILRENYSMGVEIHMEDMKFIVLNNVISSFTGKIRSYTIGHRMVRGKDYIQILVPFSAGKEECSLVMKELINLTYEKIRDEYNRLIL